MMSDTILVTGADGYVGRSVWRRLLTDTDARLVLAVRATNKADLDRKRASLPQRAGRLEVVAADLRSSQPFAAIAPRQITHILHTAAVTRFNVDVPDAQAVNVEGTEKVLSFAGRCGELQRLAFVSTIYTAGRRTGSIDEAAHDDSTGFVNHYEWSKWAAERRVLDVADNLPVTILRLGTLIADDDTGTVVQHNAFHNTFRLIYYGLLSVVPGAPDTPIYLLTSSLASAAVAHLVTTPGASGIYHVCPDATESLTLSQLLDVVMDVFEQSEAYRSRRLLRPLLCDRDAFEGLVAGSQALGASPLRQAIGSVAPFAEQLFLQKDCRNPRLRAALASYASPDPAQLVRATATSLVATRWGRATGKVAQP